MSIAQKLELQLDNAHQIAATNQAKAQESDALELKLAHLQSESSLSESVQQDEVMSKLMQAESSLSKSKNREESLKNHIKATQTDLGDAFATVFTFPLHGPP
jgi:hypothetical protein